MQDPERDAPVTSSHWPSPNAERLRDDALAWFARRRDAGWRAEDEAAFQAWLAADPRHGPAYAQCSAQWRELDGMPADLVARMRGTLARDKGRLAPPAPQPSRRRFLSGPAYAAVAAMAVGGAGHLAWRHMQAQPVHTQSLRTERGQQMEARMADGSLLRLDTATRLDVAYYRHRREVRLQDGQAMFEVQTDADRPFHVLAGPVRVTVVGTRFSVRYTPGLPGNAGVQVAVEAGRVRVAPLASGEAGPGRYDLLAGTLLGAGQQIAANELGEPGPITAVPPDGIAPWRQQRVSFVDVPLGQALAELERYHPTGLMVRDPRAAALRLSGTFDPMATDALRKALPRVLPVRLQAQDGRIEVLPAR